jgi:Ca2+-binding RTX toxin-like protein
MAVVNGTAGNDVIHVAGDGVIVPPGYIDIALATAANDTLNGFAGVDLLFGGGGRDLLDGGDGNDLLIGGAGADTLVGGAGIDTARYDSSTAVRVVLATGRGDFGDAEGDVITGVENVVGTAFDDALLGSAVANTLSGLGAGDSIQGLEGNDTLLGGDGDDALEGGAGADRLDGGAGADTINYFNSGTRVTVDLGLALCSGGEAQGDVISGIDNVNGSSLYGDILTGSAVANMLSGWGGNDSLTGLGGNDQLNGGDGDDILRGGAGTDAFDGGDGIDLISFYGAAVRVSIDLFSGVGLYGDAQGDTYAGIENVNGGTAGDIMIGGAADNILNGYEGNDTLFGYYGNDMLIGGAGDDALEGGNGADRLSGGGGIDTIAYAGSVGVTVSLAALTTSGGEAEGDVIGADLENVDGTDLDDALTGSAVANRLRGYVGNDTLDGLGGADTLIGGVGDDTLRGGDGDDFLYVSTETDVMDGGAGRDTMVLTRAMVADWQAGVLDADIGADVWRNWEVIQGSDGNDRIRTNSWGFAVELRGGGGDDELATGVTGVVGDTLSGEAGNDRLDGGAGNDVLRGGAGADVLMGSAGSDAASYYSGTTGILVSLATGAGSGGEAQGDTLSGIENLSGSQGWDSLYGNAGANVLQGWNGNDLLVGRAGKDMLTGGAGVDRFQFTALADSVVGANADRITDFSRAQGDRIDLAGIDARFTVAGDQAFTFIGTAAFTGVAGQLHIWHDAGRTIVSGDVNGNRTADFNIVLTGTINLVAGDFVL